MADNKKSLLDQIKKDLMKNMSKSERSKFKERLKFIEGSQNALAEYFANQYKLNDSNNG